jgi:UPF0716 protein FxsA
MVLRVKWILTGFVALPALELACFIAVASRTGVLAAVALSVATSLIGLWLLRSAGISALVQFRGQPRRGKAMHGRSSLAAAAAGLLLTLPGFLTDVLGLLLLLPAFRRWALGLAARCWNASGAGPGRHFDLDPAEWRRLGEADSLPARNGQVRF